MKKIVKNISVLLFFSFLFTGCGPGLDPFYHRYYGNYSYYNTNDFISVWNTIAAAQVITLPLRSGYNYDADVDWGDGTVTHVSAYNDPNAIHSYTDIGEHTITISGLMEAWHFNNSGDKDRILRVPSLGQLGWKNLAHAFEGTTNLNYMYAGNTSEVTDMSAMFSNSGISFVDTSTWDLQNVNSFTDIFTGVTLPTSSYAAFLNRVDSTNSFFTLTIDGGNSHYGAEGAAARANLMGRSWIINDAGF